MQSNFCKRGKRRAKFKGAPGEEVVVVVLTCRPSVYVSLSAPSVCLYLYLPPPGLSPPTHPFSPPPLLPSSSPRHFTSPPPAPPPFPTTSHPLLCRGQSLPARWQSTRELPPTQSGGIVHMHSTLCAQLLACLESISKRRLRTSASTARIHQKHTRRLRCCL